MTKFIFTGLPRTGTTVIGGSIVTHPDILFYGEIFNNTPQVREAEAQRITLGAGWKLAPLDWAIPACSYTESSYNYMNELFAREVPFKVMGFKLLYDQVTEGPNSDVWSYIADHPEINIIRTKRENLIEIICSYVRATMTHRWHTTEEKIPKHRFVVPPEQFLALLKRFEKLPEPMLGIDETHDVLELDYGHISSDFQACMSDIFSFLGVDAGEVVSPKLKKIGSMTPDEELVNYEELKQHFKDTKYSQYFIF